jgi:hypothetical protein
MGTAVGAMYSYLENGAGNDYILLSAVMIIVLIGAMVLGRNL